MSAKVSGADPTFGWPFSGQWASSQWAAAPERQSIGQLGHGRSNMTTQRGSGRHPSSIFCEDKEREKRQSLAGPASSRTGEFITRAASPEHICRRGRGCRCANLPTLLIALVFVFGRRVGGSTLAAAPAPHRSRACIMRPTLWRPAGQRATPFLSWPGSLAFPTVQAK